MPFTQKDLAKFKQLYLSTGRKYVEDMKEHTKLLLQSTDNPVSIHAILIAAHSLAGQSSMAGYPNVAEVSKKIEQLFTNVEAGKETLDKEKLQQAQADVEILFTYLDEIDNI
jgi:chemotaxis protein histidine kinase CheA